MHKLYALHDENGPIWLKQAKHYGAPRPSKRVYFREGDAKSGIHHLPSHIDKSTVKIVEYVPVQKNEVVVEEWHYSCGESGCCDDYGTSIYVNGVELSDLMWNPQDHFSEALQAVLDAVGVNATVTQSYRGEM